ncbi:MAG: 2-(1,2-epoxy-1,2-dihydrophenyl)acetyl-CoA isomerase [Bacteroidetes bacterium]|nr:2-(1,2-epoxy-1,2-dihydrophenyl)acetyl-CoA isomerase [Bacteroidota bacterium]
MDFSSILYEKKGRAAYITLNRPDVYNAFDDSQSYELQDALKTASRDNEVRVIVLTGAGKAFCSGQDLKAIAGSKNRSLRDSLDKRYNPIITAMREMPKPIIGMINGVAAGAGCSLALACDFIVASEKASFIEVFINVGLVLDSGSSYFLPRLVGSARAFEMSTMGTKVPAQQAMEWGMINRVVASEELESETAKVVAYYENAPTKAIALMKRMLNKSFNSDLATMLEYEACCQEIAGKSEDYQEGVKAFNERRTPEFKGC